MSHFIIDEGFDYFLEKFGQPDWQQPVDQATLNYYQDKLPNRLLFYWQQFGFCRFKKGLFWIVNPADYEDELALWLGEDILKQDNYYVIARSGFGELYVWGEKTGFAFEITPTLGWVRLKQGDAKDIATGLEDRKLELFFAFQQI